MRNAAPRYLLVSQAVLGLSLAVCTLIEPGFLFSTDQGGISNFATLASTVVPVSIGFVAAAAGAVLGARALPLGAPFRRASRWALGALAALYLLALVTGYVYKDGPALRETHENVVISLFVYMLLVGVGAFVGPARGDRGAAAWLAVIAVGVALAALTLFGFLHVLFTAQVVTGVGFAALLVRAARAASPHAGAGTPPAPA